MSDVIPHTPPTRVAVNGIEIVYDAFGAPDAPPMLLIMGLGCQMIDWKDEFCTMLAAPGVPGDPVRQPRRGPVHDVR